MLASAPLRAPLTDGPTPGRGLSPAPPPGEAPATPSASAARMQHVDGLRALAALAVALFHCLGYAPLLAAALPRVIYVPIRYGYLGVHVFFVLSGFVIAHNLRDARFSLGFAGRFALRRSLRLDPPYWATLAVAALSLSRDPAMAERLRPASLLAHATYFQAILGFPHLIEIFWTLCIEIQLYLVFVLLAWLAQRIQAKGHALEPLMALVTLLSHGVAFAGLSSRLAPWFIVYWYMFSLGAWIRWALDRPQARPWLALWAILAMARAHLLHGPGPILCLVVAALLYLAARHPLPSRLLGTPLLARFGRISYSFYLLHVIVLSEVFGRLRGRLSPTLLRDGVAVAGALALAGLAAVIWYLLLERPAIAWSRRIRLTPRGEA